MKLIAGTNSITCSLNAFDLQYLVMLAERRNCGKQPNGVTNKKVDKLSDFSINLHGVMGEYAVANLLGVKVDTSVNLAGDDKISDLKLGNGTIQVKTNMARWEKLYLYFRGPECFKASVAVLTAVRCATEIEILGWVPRDIFFKKATVLSFMGSSIVGMDSRDLEKPEYLKTYLETL